MKKSFLFLIAVSLTLWVSAQSTKARQEIHDNILLSASNYVAYVDPTLPLTPAPKGYEPFYLTHYGRHGSRWLIGEWEYQDAMGVLQRAHENGKLTERGELLRMQMEAICQSATNRRGELTGVGERQHHRIGKRMTEHFPEIFKAKNTQVDARSTVVIRCILSMVAECEEISSFNPNVKIHNDVSESLQYYLNAGWEKRIHEDNSVKWKSVFDYNKEYVHPERFWSLVMNDPDYRDEKIASRSTFMKRVFDIAGNMQSHFGNEADNVSDKDIRSNDIQPENGIVNGQWLDSKSLFDLFTEDEAYNLWRCKNIEWYVNYSSGISPFTQKNLLRNFLETADTIVSSKDYHGATLRFGHEVCVMPLAALLELGDCYPDVPMDSLQNLDAKWANYRIFPMASNIQLVFYRSKKGKDGDILVKALLNEREQTLPVKTDMYPYYKWSTLRTYYEHKLTSFEKPKMKGRR